MKTAALLPIHDDPLSLRFWLANYEAVWKDEVDELVILISGPGAADVPAEGTNVRVIRHPGHIIHTGDALEELVAATDADILMFCEDDAYVRTPGAVAGCIAKIASGEADVIGSPREPASEELIWVSHAKFGGRVHLDEDFGNAVWPCFAFVRRSTLEQTNGKIGPTAYVKGDYVPGLDYTVQQETASDETFVGTCWQMRANGARFMYVRQYRINDPMLHDLAATNPPWFHVGSLSSGAGLSRGALDGDEQTNLAHIATNPSEFIRRISWWRRFADSAPPSKVRNVYSKALDHLVDAAKLDHGAIAERTRLFDSLVSWT